MNNDSKRQGLRFNEGKLRYELLPAFAMQELVRVYTKGSEKYADRNWELGMDWSKVIASLKRHIAAFESGEDYDLESKCYHMAHAMCNCSFLLEYYKTHPEYDNRPHKYYNIPKIGLDIDETICNFVSAYCKRYDLPIPHCWNFDPLMPERMKELRNDKHFWLNLEPLINLADLPFEPAAYITSRPIDNAITQEWLWRYQFPVAPVITVSSGNDKIEHCKQLELDYFVDDNFSTFAEMNKSGICCFLMDAKHNQRYDVGHKRVKSLVELKDRW